MSKPPTPTTLPTPEILEHLDQLIGALELELAAHRERRREAQAAAALARDDVEAVEGQLDTLRAARHTLDALARDQLAGELLPPEQLLAELAEAHA